MNTKDKSQKSDLDDLQEYKHPHNTQCLYKGSKVDPILTQINDDGKKPHIELFSAYDRLGKHGITRFYFRFELPIANQHVFIKSSASGNTYNRLPKRSQIYNTEGIFGDIADVYIAQGQHNNALSILGPDTMADMLRLLHTCDIEIHGRTVYIVYVEYREDQVELVKKLATEMYQDATRRVDKSVPLADPHQVEHTLTYSMLGGIPAGTILQAIGITIIAIISAYFLRSRFDRATSKLIGGVITAIFVLVFVLIARYIVLRKRSKLSKAIKHDFTDKK